MRRLALAGMDLVRLIDRQFFPADVSGEGQRQIGRNLETDRGLG